MRIERKYIWAIAIFTLLTIIGGIFYEWETLRIKKPKDLELPKYINERETYRIKPKGLEQPEYIKKPRTKEENLSPREIVEKFLQADMAGARLGIGIADELREEIGKYYTLSSGYPTGFVYEGDLLMVVKSAEIIEEYPGRDEASYFVRVKYFCEEGIASGFTGFKGERVIKEIPSEVDKGILVSFDCSNFFSPLADPSIIKYDDNEKTETITFELIKDGDSWKLNSPSICPRISKETFERFLATFDK